MAKVNMQVRLLQAVPFQFETIVNRILKVLFNR